ncbi:MAG TPA: glycosyltransferase family 4 protein [bacterium]|jgi:glycosyltransferase involved in cell wall biosynthesis|nr:MAG: Glycogen synthase [bacterium ADurb.Bin270]HPW45206.1 glycosyltransferase family 4 protein [bacterium]HQC50472.1 glycosyltransferase family 4 protein [bacterium]HQH79843.1 glycosyltransferase family 4 protein [bacterium]
MKVLMITWEFPPFIAGGLGMACYGIAKSLLSEGVEIDLILPTKEEVYFPLRKPDDADLLPLEFLDPARKKQLKIESYASLSEKLKLVGVSAYPESYLTPGFDFESFIEYVWSMNFRMERSEVDRLRAHLRGDEPIFRKVQELAFRVLSHVQKMSFDVIHAHDWLTYPAGIAAKGLTGKPLVSHIHATEFDRAGGVGDDRIHNIEYQGLNAADRVVSVSQYTASMIMNRYRIDNRKIRVVRNAYSVSQNVENEKKRLFKDPLVLFLGRITLQKGPDYFVEVAERVLKRFPKVRFIMAGTGDMFSRMLKRSAVKRLGDRFLFSGFLNRDQVERILSATDMFVMPSVSEPFGIVPLEAMAFGSLAILSKQSGVSEVVENAFKVDFWDVDKTADIIVRMLENPDEMRRIAMAGKEEVLAIGWKKAAQELVSVYREF